MRDGVAEPASPPLPDPLEDIQHGPHGSVCIRVDMHVKAGLLDSIHDRLNFFRGKRHLAPDMRFVAKRIQEQRPPAHQGSVRPHFTDADLQVFGFVLAVPLLQPSRNFLGIIVRTTGPDGAHDSNRQFAGPIILDQLFVDRGGRIAGFPDQDAGLKIAGDALGGGPRQRQLLGFARRLRAEGSQTHQHGQTGRSFDRMAGGPPFFVPAIILFAGLGIRGLVGQPASLHRGGVKPHVVGVSGQQQHRPIPRDLIQPLPTGTPGLKGIGHPSVSEEQSFLGLLCHPRADLGQNRGLSLQTGHGNSALGDRSHRQMVVAVDKTRKTQPAFEINLLGLGSRHGPGFRLRPHHFNPVPPNDEGLGPRLFRIHRVDGSAPDQGGGRRSLKVEATQSSGQQEPQEGEGKPPWITTKAKTHRVGSILITKPGGNEVFKHLAPESIFRNWFGDPRTSHRIF